MVAYLLTLSDTVSGGDSGELIAVAHRLGVAHPPGYPLYTLLGKLFSSLPFGAAAWRVNLFSAVCDAAAVFLLCQAAGRWTGNLWAGVLASGLFAFSPVIWPYAITAEVFALNNLFVAGLLYLSVRATLEPAQRTWILPIAMFWIGLGLTNHHTLLFFALPIGAYLITLRPARSSMPRHLLRLGIALGAGLLPYAYLPIASASLPPITWGDPTSWNGFVAHVLRQEYGTFQLATGSASTDRLDLLPRLTVFWHRLAATTFWLGPLLLLGVVLALIRSHPMRFLTAVWVGAIAFYLLVFSYLANLPLEVPILLTLQDRFWQQAVVLATALMGIGLFEASRRLSKGWCRTLRVGLSIGMPTALLITTFPTMDKRAHELIRDYGEAILLPIEPNAILLTSSDETTGSVRFLQLVEGRRTDIRIIPTGLLNYAWYRKFAAKHLPGVILPPGGPTGTDFTAREFMDANIDRFPIYIMNKEPWLQTLEQAYTTWPVGLPYQVMPKGQHPDLASWVKRAEASFDRFDAELATRFGRGSWPQYVAEIYWQQYQRYGFRLAEAARESGDDVEVARLVIGVLERLSKRHPSPEPAVFKNLGVAYQFLARTDQSAVRPMATYWRRYLDTHPTSDPDLEAMRSIVERAERWLK